MNKIEMNLAIAGIKGYIPYDSKNGVRLKVMIGEHAYFTMDVPDYLSPELNHGLFSELGLAGWEYYADDGYHFWGKNDGLAYFELHDEDLSTATALAYIEAFK